MGPSRETTASSSPSPSGDNSDDSIIGPQRQHQQDLENLTLTAQPFKTLKLFGLAIAQYLKQSIFYLRSRVGFLVILGIVASAPALLLLMVDGPHEKHVEELSKYIQFGLWWVALGVASSIGLGSGLHTFVLYLGPHLAFFTIKAMQCGRVDLKSAPYDTIQLKRGPSWLDKECSEFGVPLFTSQHGGLVPLSSILPQVQIEAILWGIGTALGELPPYFISRAARLSGSAIDDAMEEFEVSSSKESGIIARHLAHMKSWLLSHSQHLNFFTILVLASVPNPLFDLAGIMCGQFGIPFWKFFLATFIGKAIIKTHIQTILIISVCNNQLLNYMENLILLLGFIPGFSSFLPSIMFRLNAVRDKYLTVTAPPIVTSNIKVKKWDLSFASIWNTVVWLVLINFFSKIVTATAQNYMKKQQQQKEEEKELLHSLSGPPTGIESN